MSKTCGPRETRGAVGQECVTINRWIFLLVTRRHSNMLYRRDFLGMAAGTLLGAGTSLLKAEASAPASKSILMLGGTGFLGPHTVEAALRRGHKVTLFNRGKTRPGLFPDLEKLHGDRAKDDLKALEGRKWDAVVDTSANVPRWVRKAAEVLAPNVGHYVYISSVSVYADLSKPGADETAPVSTIDRSDDRENRRPDLRSAQGTLGEGRRNGDARQGGRRAAGPDRRA